MSSGHNHHEHGHRAGHGESRHAETTPGVIWTCPMHPQIRWDHPGNCPICGMALEPLEPALGEEANPELRDMTWRFWVSAALSVPIIVLSMGPELFGWTLLPPRTSIIVQLALATPVVAWRPRRSSSYCWCLPCRFCCVRSNTESFELNYGKSLTVL